LRARLRKYSPKEGLTVYQFPREHWKRLQPSSVIERVDEKELLPYDEKCFLAKDFLEKLISKFSRAVDKAVFKELDRIFANLESAFILQRSSTHLAKLAYSIYFIRRKLSRDMATFPFRDYFDLRVFPSSLQFTFGSKPVLSILTHAQLKDKYEVFDEEQILFLIRTAMPEAQLVKDSTYTFQASKNTVKTLYFEINKKSGLPFTHQETKQLKELLKRKVKFSIEKLVPRVFMIRNEEEILKNILILSREIHFRSDPPQVMILLDQQTHQEVLFTVILVRLLSPEEANIRECFSRASPGIEFLLDRCQIVRYLRKKYPLEASVFRIKLAKSASLLRSDKSLNFYLARQKVSRILTEVIGDFRDYNGGIIIKQREALSSFIEAFRDLSLKEPDLLENFYYSLSPIEMQATLPLESLKTFFSLFLEAREFNVTKPSDAFLKFQILQKQLFVLVRTPEEAIKNEIDAILSEYNPTRKVVTFHTSAQNTHLLGYLLVDLELEVQQQLSASIEEALKAWKQKVESRQILKLSLERSVVSLDPRIGGDETSSMILQMLFEGLMRINRVGKLEQGVAQAVEISNEHKTYLFKLRPTLWSNRSLVSAHDFEYAWKKVLSPSFKTPFAYLFYPIKNAKLAKSGLVSPDAIGVKALDDFTLKVELEFPAPHFLELTALPIYSPVHRQMDQRHPNWILEDKNAYICNGAFQPQKNNPNTGYELVKNKLYWDAANIRLDEVSILKSNRYHAYEMFQKEMNHWIGPPLTSWDPSFSFQENDESVAFLETSVFWFVFNTQCFPFHHKKIRKALAFGIDRAKLQETIDVPLSFSPIPPIHSQVDSSPLSENRLEEAKRLFEEALEELRIPREKFPLVPIIYSESAVRDKIAHFIQREWEEAFGISCSLQCLEWRSLFSKMTQGDFQLGGFSWASWINDPTYTFNVFRDPDEPINLPKWKNRQYQDILCLAEKEIESIHRKPYYLEAEKLLLEEMPVIPIFSLKGSALKKKNFRIDHSSPLVNFKWGYFA